MQQYVVIAYDAKDDGAHERRLRIRASHVESVNRLRAEGKILVGVAITDENAKMIGSVVITSFSTRGDFDNWLKHEPYVMGKVWEDITVLTGEIGPSFVDLVKGA